jgi:hypothetical protein
MEVVLAYFNALSQSTEGPGNAVNDLELQQDSNPRRVLATQS